MKQLTKARFMDAREYIRTLGRELERRLFEYHFESAGAGPVLDELEKYQNQDGGFGNALEPDLRTAHSSVLATSQAFFILREVGASSDEPVVRRGIGYLLATYDSVRGVWPIIPKEASDSPHPWWWNYDEVETNFGGFLVNPRAAVVGHLQHYGAVVPSSSIAETLGMVLDHLDGLPDEMGMHDLLCYRALAEAAGLPTQVRARLVSKLRRVASATVERDPARWGEYCLTPAVAVPSPQSCLFGSIEQAVLDTHLDLVVSSQLEDGSWPVSWSWEEVDAEAWACAEREWKGHLTLANLNTLRAHGRLPQ